MELPFASYRWSWDAPLRHMVFLIVVGELRKCVYVGENVYSSPRSEA